MTQQTQDKLINHPAAKLEVGHKMVCPECDTELVVSPDTYKGTTKNRWSNVSGGWHIKSVDGQYIHQKAGATTNLPVGEKFDEATSDELKMESRMMETDDKYQRLAVTQVKKRGSTVRGDIVAHEKEMLLRIKQNQLLDALIGAAQGRN